MINRTFGLVGQREKFGVFLEAFRHGELIDKFIIALNRLSFRRFPCDGGLYTWFGYVVTDAPLFPIRISGAKTLLSQFFLFVGSDFVVSDGDALATTTTSAATVAASAPCSW